MILSPVHWDLAPASPNVSMSNCHCHRFLCTELLMMWQIIMATVDCQMSAKFHILNGRQVQVECGLYKILERKCAVCCLSKCIQLEWALLCTATLIGFFDFGRLGLLLWFFGRIGSAAHFPKTHRPISSMCCRCQAHKYQQSLI